MNVRVIITAVLALPGIFLAMRYNLHMLQLNGYKNKEHVNRMLPEVNRQWLLLSLLVTGLLRIWVKAVALDILIWVLMLLTIMQYNFWRKHNVKKKLVYTARVKRIVVVNVLLTLIFLALPSILIDWRLVAPLCVVLTGAQLFLPIITNIVNHPMEWAVNRHYINDAKRILKAAPNLKVIGVTGSFGKTSVKFYLLTLLQEFFNVLATPESFNTPMGIVKTIRGSLKPTHEIFICEMGARHVGDIKEDCDIVRPDHAVITSIGPQHLETFYNMENIQKTKFEIADALPEGGMLFLNGDNDYIKEKAVEYNNKIFYYSTESPDGFYAKDVKVTQTGTEFTVHAPDGEEERFCMRLLGSQNVVNVVGAIAVAKSLGISLKQLVVPVRRIQPVEHRMKISHHGEVSIIDDAYNSNPVGSKMAVETLKDFDGVRILVTPGMVELGEKEKEYNYLFGTYAADCCDYIFLVGPEHSAPIKEGVLAAGFPESKCMTFDKLEDAMKQAYAVKDLGHKYILLENDLPDNYR